MTPQVLRVLRFLRVTDENNNLSLTNLALVATLVRLYFLPNISVHDLGMFLATVVGYQVKRFAAPVGAPDDTEALKVAVSSLQTKVSALQIGQQLNGKR